MRIFKSLALAVMIGFLFLGGMATANAGDQKCATAEQFMTDINKGAKQYDLLYLTGQPLEVFVASMDSQSGGGHGDMSGLVFLNPEGNQNKLTIIAVFVKGCYAAVVEVPTSMVAKALGAREG